MISEYLSLSGWALHIQTEVVKTECHLAPQWNDILQDEKSIHIHTLGVLWVLSRGRCDHHYQRSGHLCLPPGSGERCRGKLGQMAFRKQHQAYTRHVDEEKCDGSSLGIRGKTVQGVSVFSEPTSIWEVSKRNKWCDGFRAVLLFPDIFYWNFQTQWIESDV